MKNMDYVDGVAYFKWRRLMKEMIAGSHLNTEDIAKILGVTRTTLWNWVGNVKFTSVTRLHAIGSLILFKKIYKNDEQMVAKIDEFVNELGR